VRETADFRHATAVGVVVTLFMLALLPVAPAIPLLFGMTAAIVPMLLATRERKRYAVAGTAYCLSLGLVLAVADTVLGLAEGNTLVTGLLAFGAVSLLVVTAKAVGRRLARRTVGLLVGDEYAARVFDAIASIAALAGLMWTVLTAAEKVSRYAGFGVGGAATLGLSLVGVEYNVTVPMLGGQVDAVLFLFVGCLLAGFYTFESLHTTWLAAKETAKKSVDAGGTVKSKTASAVADRRGGGGSAGGRDHEERIEQDVPENTEARTRRRDPDQRRAPDDRRGGRDRRNSRDRSDRRNSRNSRNSRDRSDREDGTNRRSSDERRNRRDADERRDGSRRRRGGSRRRRDRRDEEDDDRDAGS
jgi:hypothetical protein